MGYWYTAIIIDMSAQDPRPQLLWVDGTPKTGRDDLARELAKRGRLRQVCAFQLSARAMQGDWDLICFDFDGPRVADLELVAKARTRWPAAVVLVLASECSLEVAVWALRAQVSDLLIKPLAPQDIARCARRVEEIARKRYPQAAQHPHAEHPRQPARSDTRPSAGSSIRLRRAIDYIARNHMRQLPETEVALVCEMSPSWFCREFKAAFGATYLEYLTRYRISRAKRLLADATLAITDVAAAVGFTDPSYFTRVFRRIAGRSPSEYRDSLTPGEYDLSLSATGTLSIPPRSGFGH